MEKIKQKRLQHFSLVRLYKDDLLEIINIFERNLKTVSIEADGYKLKNSTQINDLTKATITNFSIQGYLDERSFLEYVSLVLKNDNVYILLTDDTNTTFLGVESRLRSLLQRRKTLSYYLASSYLFFTYTLSFFFMNLTISTLNYYFKSELLSSILTIVSISLIPISLIYFIWWLIIRNKFRTLIYLSDYSTRAGFLKRNKDQIILLLIGAMLGSLGTILVTWLSVYIQRK